MNEMIYGRRPVLEALQAGRRRIHKIWIADNSHGESVAEILRLAEQKGVPVEKVGRGTERRSAGAPVRNLSGVFPAHVHHQGIAAQVSAAAFADLDGFLKGLPGGAPALLVALDEIQDPQNVGAILRSVGFFGVAGVIVPEWRSAPIGETAWRVSSGAAEHLTMIRVGNLAEAIRQMQDAGFEVVGADAAGEPAWQTPFAKRVVLVIGSEGKGLRRLVKERCDRLVGIPVQGPVASLNAAAAASVLLYEIQRSRSSVTSNE
jgi:23S rRNA (guanosine2251-2'-O)-methyltransferase